MATGLYAGRSLGTRLHKTTPSLSPRRRRLLQQSNLSRLSRATLVDILVVLAGTISMATVQRRKKTLCSISTQLA